ncbi:aldehyde dehydrogenase family protein [Nocardioides sp. cx-173]|uniref:aldehyde dehydrogenase family protein n=1 Tax=Nocardioides sp. cx-173 TaxID=2898796 RepID=UPI001E41373D|nr:aldehyde dehydrogenase family protein [Nocardioides sp. cx-173]MCD4524292.1 aldehyde dehydrogenase family protein [Nocardioides sp. cx-173]UGB41684.1 aldehyde dehydrogenase family protein [Nocardioides sp. cx-173]
MAGWHEDRLLIDGELVTAEGGRTYENISPSTEEVLGVAADATVGDTRRAIAAARRAFDETDWSTDRDLRVRCLRQLHDGLTEKKEEIRQIMIDEVGMPLAMTYVAGVDEPIKFLGWYADQLETFEFSEDLGVRTMWGRDNHRWIEKEAAGVVAAITGYNVPIHLAIAKLGPALAAGCTVVLKAAPQTPWSLLAIGHVIAEMTDIPAGVVNVITSSELETGVELTVHPDVDVVTFTGSTGVGKQIMSAASGTLKRVLLELGGKSASIVLDDGDLAAGAQAAATNVLSHAGQGCSSTTRLVVPRARLSEAEGILAGILGNAPYGDVRDPAHWTGPLITADQQAKVAGYVERAIADGAKVVVGGEIPQDKGAGYWYAPTLIVNADENSEIAQDELFGPVLVLLAHDGEEDAIRIANNSIFGLSGAVWGADRERALKVARAIRTGTFAVNGGSYYAPDAPFGGYKQSGLGREMGLASFGEFLQHKTIAESVAAPA